MRESLLDRFVRYAKINTRSDLNSNAVPTTKSQLDFLQMLEQELKELGFSNISLDLEDAYLVACIPSNLPEGKTAPAIGFVAHVDTADFNAENIQPQIHSNYDGKDVLLNSELGLMMRVEEFPNLKNYIGQTLITTDGTTLLGADDKAGLVSILEAAIDLLDHPEILHGDIWVAFGPDEEIGKGAHRFKAERMPVQFAYTLDSGVVGKLEYETQYANDKKNGISKKYYPSGKLLSEVTFKDDKEVGVLKGYSENGKLEGEIPYNNGVVEGVVKVYHENGKVNEEITFKNGKKNGPMKIYDENGNLKRQSNFVDDRQVD